MIAYLWYPFPREPELVGALDAAGYDCYQPGGEATDVDFANLVVLPPLKEAGDGLYYVAEQLCSRLEHINENLVLPLFRKKYGEEWAKHANVPEWSKMLATWVNSRSPDLRLLSELFILLRTSLIVSTTTLVACIDMGPVLAMTRRSAVSIGIGSSPESLWFQSMFDYVIRHNQLEDILQIVGNNGPETTNSRNSERGSVRST